jgi:hypothetical protein
MKRIVAFLSKLLPPGSWRRGFWISNGGIVLTALTIFSVANVPGMAKAVPWLLPLGVLVGFVLMIVGLAQMSKAIGKT